MSVVLHETQRKSHICGSGILRPKTVAAKNASTTNARGGKVNVGDVLAVFLEASESL